MGETDHFLCDGRQPPREGPVVVALAQDWLRAEPDRRIRLVPWVTRLGQSVDIFREYASGPALVSGRFPCRSNGGNSLAPLPSSMHSQRYSVGSPLEDFAD